MLNYMRILDSEDGKVMFFVIGIGVGGYNSRKSFRWSAVPVAPKLVNVCCESERGSGPEGADDLCWAKI